MSKTERYYCDKCKAEIEKIDLNFICYYDKWCIGYDENNKPKYATELREVMLCNNCADRLINFKEVRKCVPLKIRPV